MGRAIPDDEIRIGLDLAVTIGVLERYGVHRHVSEAGPLRDRRRWYLTFADGDLVNYTPSAADAFALGVRLAAEALGGGPQ
jgi:peptidoglycan/xylan/chitin deacetylase (PgdA/CDA1 family)